jgi:hypothetical protein
MSNTAKKHVNASSAADLRRTFETAFTQLQRRGEPAKVPIAVRNQDNMADEKRALNSAARALAQLWNISPSLVR